jgi:hypothetical protein
MVAGPGGAVEDGMIKPKAALAAICTLSTAVGAHEEDPVPAPPPPPSTAGREFHVVASGLLGLEGARRHRYGFVLDGQLETPVPHWFDLAFGAGFGRLETRQGPLTFALGEFSILRQAPVASFFGIGLGAAFLDSAAQPAGRMTAGIEAFHNGPIPIQLGIDLLAKFCTESTKRDCTRNDTRTYVAARLGLRM